MAAGDIINGLTVSGTPVNFQPAVGVSILITTAVSWLTSTLLTDGAIVGYISNSGSNGEQRMTKLFINNSIYLQLFGSVNGQSYTGIQIK